MWRRFNFFDKEQYDVEDPRAPGLSFTADGFGLPTCTASGRGQLVFANAKGLVRLVNRQLEKHEFPAYDGEITHMTMLRTTNTLVTIGDEQHQPVLKIWNLDKHDADGFPMIIRRLPIFSAKFPQTPITAFAVLQDLTQCVVGLATGAVLLFDSHIIKGTPKQSLLQREGPPITSLHYREDDNYMTPTSANPHPDALFSTSLFITTPTTVSTVFTKHPKQMHIELDTENGAEAECTCMTNDHKLVIARREAVYFYEAEERGVCFGFEGAKKLCAWAGTYLVLVSEASRDGSNSSNIMSSSVSQSSSSQSTKVLLTIYDLRNKLIAGSIKLDSLTHVVACWSSLFVLTQSAFVYQFIEKDLRSKMNALFEKNLYSIAIALAQSSNDDSSLVKSIYQMYGDHLYAKGDYDGSIAQYVETIGFTEPSFIIRKFLDAQRIHNLTRYLQALHEMGRANTDHTTLLLNCYTKAKDVKKLDEFIGSDNGLVFDVSTAITVCRQAGYFEHALDLARRHQHHELYLKIQLEDCMNYRDAVTYISSLSWSDADRFMNEYGKKLVEELPQATTLLLMDLATHWVPKPLPPGPGGVAGPVNPPAAANEKSRPEQFIHFFVERPSNLQTFLERVAEEPKASAIVYNTLLELYLRQGESEEKAGPNAANGAGLNNSQQLSHSGDIDDKYNRVHPYHSQIMNVLKNPNASYSVEHALVLCQQYGFEKGSLYLLSKLKLYTEIVAHHIAHHQHNKILKACKKYGHAMPNLWIQALSYFSSIDDICEEEISVVLEHIEHANLLPPLMVLQTLATNPNKPLAVVKDYLIKALKKESSDIQLDEIEINRYQHDTQVMREEMTKLTTQPITFQAIKCHACGAGLSLPAIHFLCMHSYHARCIAENDSECMKCAAEYRKVREIKESMKQSANQHDRFFKQLDDSQDGFATVAEYFGRGIFDDGEEDESAIEEKKQEND